MLLERCQIHRKMRVHTIPVSKIMAMALLNEVKSEWVVRARRTAVRSPVKRRRILGVARGFEGGYCGGEEEAVCCCYGGFCTRSDQGGCEGEKTREGNEDALHGGDVERVNLREEKAEDRRQGSLRCGENCSVYLQFEADMLLFIHCVLNCVPRNFTYSGLQDILTSTRPVPQSIFSIRLFTARFRNTNPQILKTRVLSPRRMLPLLTGSKSWPRCKISLVHVCCSAFNDQPLRRTSEHAPGAFT